METPNGSSLTHMIDPLSRRETDYAAQLSSQSQPVLSRPPLSITPPPNDLYGPFPPNPTLPSHLLPSYSDYLEAV